MNSILLKDGKIIFEKDHLSIKDKSRRNVIITLLSLPFTTFYAIISILSYRETGDEFMLYTGILVCVLAGIALILWVLAIFFKKGIFSRRQYDSIIPYNDIDCVNMRRPSITLIVDIILKNRKKRRVWLKDEKANAEAFKDFLQHNRVAIQVEPFTF